MWDCPCKWHRFFRRHLGGGGGSEVRGGLWGKRVELSDEQSLPTRNPGTDKQQSFEINLQNNTLFENNNNTFYSS
jgi:hypothetical protein